MEVVGERKVILYLINTKTFDWMNHQCESALCLFLHVHLAHGNLYSVFLLPHTSTFTRLKQSLNKTAPHHHYSQHQGKFRREKNREDKCNQETGRTA